MGVNRRSFYSELIHVEGRWSERVPTPTPPPHAINMKEQRVLYSNKNNHLELAGTISKVFMCKI